MRLSLGVLGLMARGSMAILLSFALLATPLWAAPASSLGVVVFANRARLGNSGVSVGSTIFSGDRLSTDEVGSVQVRAGAARFLMSSSSAATLIQEDGTPAATLALGSATFSTANSKAFAIHFASAVVRPKTDQPTIGLVKVLGAKELAVKCIKGSLSIAVEDEVREIPEGAAYRVVLDPNADPQGPRGAGTKGIGGPPIKAAKSKFIWFAIAVAVGVTAYAASEVYESPEKP